MLLQTVRDGNAETSGEMIVATPGEPQLLCLSRERLPPDRPCCWNRREMLERLRDMSTGKPVVTVPTLRLDRQQTACQQLCDLPPSQVTSQAQPARQRWRLQGRCHDNVLTDGPAPIGT